MSIIISHHLGVEFFRNLRSIAMPRQQAMTTWLSSPNRYQRIVQHGGIDLARGTRIQSGSRRRPILDAATCNEVLKDSRVPTRNEIARMRQSIAALSEANSTFHTLVDKRGKRRDGGGGSELLKCHLVSGQLWDGALWQINEGVFVCSPELLFIQMANALPRPLLVRFGMELCGGYCIQPKGGRGFDDVYSVTTPEKLLGHISEASRVKGRKEALIAVHRVLPNAASPAETDIYIVMCFPRKEGGYGLRTPELNGKVTIKLLNGKQFERFCDLLWIDFHLALEYLGVDSHTTWSAVANDATRQADLAMEGVRVIPVTKEHVGSINRLDYIAESMARKMRLDRSVAVQDFRKKQLALHSTIYPWAH